ncbi:MAG: LexA family transcriptional regulator [Cyclobacteriaceae bacterium]|nr:LexA family transcriptional regulator [Cyclobacteriaceae bacterium]
MTLISENIKYLRKKTGDTQGEFAEKIGLKRSLVGAYEEGRADPRISNLIKMAEIFDVSVDTIINTDITKMTDEQLSFNKNSRGSEILAITVDEQGNENVELVPQKAAAGYTNGYADPEFIKELPKFHLPILPKNATYRAFEIHGDSMLPLLSGTIVVGEYIDNLKNIKNGKTYILVTRKEGVVYKRLFNYIDEKGSLFLVSDNKQYSPYEITPEEVLEVWASKAYISVQFPDIEPEKDVSVGQLASMVLDLQKEIVNLKERD